jgi:hypothetical protein
MPRNTEKQKRDKARARGEEVFEPMNGSTVKAMFNLIRNLYGNPHNLGTTENKFTDEYDWKALQAKATQEDYDELLFELAKTDRRAYDKLYSLDPTVALTFEEFKKANPPSPAKVAELKAKYPGETYLVTPEERQYLRGVIPAGDAEFKAKSEVFLAKKETERPAGPPPEAVALSTKSGTQSAGGEPPRAFPRDGDRLSRISSSVLSTPSRERPKYGSVMAKALETGAELPDLKALLKLSDQDYLDLLTKRQKVVNEAYASVNPGKVFRAKDSPPSAPKGYESYLYPESTMNSELSMLQEKTKEIYYRLRDERFAREREERKKAQPVTQAKKVVDEKPRPVGSSDKVFTDAIAEAERRGNPEQIKLAKLMFAEHKAEAVVGPFKYRDPTPQELLMAVAGADGSDFFDKKELARRKHQGDIIAMMKAQAGEKK